MKKFALQNSSFSPICEKNPSVQAQNLSNKQKSVDAQPLTSELLSRLFTAMKQTNGNEKISETPQKEEKKVPPQSIFDNRIYTVMKQHDALSKKIDERLSKRP